MTTLNVMTDHAVAKALLAAVEIGSISKEELREFARKIEDAAGDLALKGDETGSKMLNVRADVLGNIAYKLQELS